MRFTSLGAALTSKNQQDESIDISDYDIDIDKFKDGSYEFPTPKAKEKTAAEVEDEMDRILDELIPGVDLKQVGVFHKKQKKKEKKKEEEKKGKTIKAEIDDDDDDEDEQAQEEEEEEEEEETEMETKSNHYDENFVFPTFVNNEEIPSTEDMGLDDDEDWVEEQIFELKQVCGTNR